MRNLVAPLRRHQRWLLPSFDLTRSAHKRAPRQPPPPPRPPPSPPKPPQKPETFTQHDTTWEDPYSWMSKLSDKVAMRHMDVYMEQEEKYTEAVMSDTDRLQAKLQSEMASRMAADLSTPPLRWGPWLYYRRVEEGKQYPVLCRRLAALNEEFMSYKSPSAGFDFRSGKRIEQTLVDYNAEAERFGGYAYEDQSEISPNHRYFAYLMYDRDNDFFKLSVRDLNSGIIFKKPQAERVCNIAWAKNGEALLYVVTDANKRPYRLYCSIIGSTDEDVLLFEAPDNTVFLKIRHTKDFRFVTVNSYCAKWSKVFLINAADPMSDMTLVWEGEPHVHCVVKHHQGHLYLFTNACRQGKPVDDHYILRKPLDATSDINKWEAVFAEDQDLIIQDVDFCDSHMVLTTREGRAIKLCAVKLPLPDGKVPFYLKDLHHSFLSLPDYVSHIYPGPNYDYYSGTMRFTVSMPVMPDAVVDYELSSGNWTIIQQKNMIRERRKILYGKSSIASHAASIEEEGSWNDLLEYYACEHYDVSSSDGVVIPLTVIYSRKHRTNSGSPGLVHGHGAYGEVLDKRWRSEFKSLLDRGWVVAYADVRGGGGRGQKWHHDGRCRKKQNSIDDYIACCKFLINKDIVQENKLAGWGYSAGGLLVAAAINNCPDLFRAAILKVPFLDPTSTLLRPISALTAADYDEFGNPEDKEDFKAIRAFSPYDNIQKGVVYPSVLIGSSLHTRFGVWEAAKWVARVRELTFYDGKRPVLLNLTTDIVEENRYLQCKEHALETAFLMKAMDF
ncbi:unnamed protein product [Rhodiola kirilowii]